MPLLNKWNSVIIGRLLRYKRNKTLQGMLILVESNPLWGRKSNSASCQTTSHQPVADYFPITACLVMLCVLLITFSLLPENNTKQFCFTDNQLNGNLHNYNQSLKNQHVCFVSLSLPLLCSSTVVVSLQAHQAKHIKPSRLRFGKEHFLFQSFINLGKDGNLNGKKKLHQRLQESHLGPLAPHRITYARQT